MNEENVPLMASSLVPGLAEMLALKEQMYAEGKTAEEVDRFFADARLYTWQEATDEMRRQGMTDKRIAEFWLSLSFGDEPESMDV